MQNIFHCDFLQDPPVKDLTHEDMFDCIITSGALEAACPDRDCYKRSITSMYHLLKPEGLVLVHGFINESFYAVGDEMFRVLPIDVAFIESTFSNAGFININVFQYTFEKNAGFDASGYFFLSAIKQ